jgi:hypothetical protein
VHLRDDVTQCSRVTMELAQRQSARFMGICLILVWLAFLWTPMEAHSMSAQEILDQVVKQNFHDSFRAVLDVKTYRGKRIVSDHSLWIMGKVKKDDGDFFIDFDKPKDSKGLRFLIHVRGGKGAGAWMYLPATGKTVPLALDDPSTDIGGTGLSMEDLRGFIPKGGENATLVKEEKTDGRDCFVIRLNTTGDSGDRLLWVAKDGFLVTRSQQMDAKGKVQRTFRVAEFFKTEKGKEFPREEEITIPGKDTRIRVRQEHAVFGVELPEEIMEPEKFGIYRWRD